jgi:prepilin-type N-terminal cleavage/methylation domain-containing protein
MGDATSMKNSSQRGFTLIEMLLVCAIAMVMAAMSAPLVMNITNTYRLRAAGGQYANMLQIARVRAVTADTYEPVYATSGTTLYGGNLNAFIDLNQNGTASGSYANTPLSEPGVVFSNSVVVKSAASAPNVTNLEGQYLNGASSSNVAINQNTWAGSGVMVVTFGSRGLPCYLTGVPPSGGAGTCSYSLANKPIAFEIFLQNQNTSQWEAVTVNPSGRVREWRYDTPSTTWVALN